MHVLRLWSMRLGAIHLGQDCLHASTERAGVRLRGFCAIRVNAPVVDIEGPHFLLQARPDAAAAVIREFAWDLKSASSSLMVFATSAAAEPGGWRITRRSHRFVWSRCKATLAERF